MALRIVSGLHRTPFLRKKHVEDSQRPDIYFYTFYEKKNYLLNCHFDRLFAHHFDIHYCSFFIYSVSLAIHSLPAGLLLALIYNHSRFRPVLIFGMQKLGYSNASTISRSPAFPRGFEYLKFHSGVS